MWDKKYWAITRPEIIGHLLVSVGLILVGVSQQLFLAISNNQVSVGDINQGIGQNISAYSSSLVNWIGQLPISPQVLTGIIWALVGALGYILFVMVINVGIAIENKYIVNKLYTNKGHTDSHTLIKRFSRIALLIVIPFWILFTFRVFYPWAVFNLENSIHNPAQPQLWLVVILSLMTLSLMQYTSVVWLRILVNQPRLFFGR